MNNIIIKAGPVALDHIKQHGLQPADISILPAAAGGPKWIALYGIDKYLLTHWFNDRKDKPLYVVGSSAGAWRVSCYAMNDQIAALERFRKAYIEQTYYTMPSSKEVTDNMIHIAKEIVNNDSDAFLTEGIVKLFILTTETPKSSLNKWPLRSKFGRAYLSNLFGRRFLARHFSRVVFTNTTDQEVFIPDNIKTRYFPITPKNRIQAIRSSGAIPILMDPPETIAGIDGHLWDGAIIDYHIAQDYKAEGLILYPHFTDKITPSWFDKKLPWRSYKGASTDRMIMISPSPKFIKSLPDSKIPEQDDFINYMSDNPKRISQWYEVSRRSEELAQEFHDIWSSGRLVDVAQPF